MVGARHGVIHERAGQQLPGDLVINRAFVQCLTDALNDPAMQLPFDDHRIDDGADVIDGGVSLERDDPGVGIDFHLGDMTAAGIGEVDRIVVSLLLEAGLQHFQRIIVRDVGGAGDLLEGLAAVGAGNRENPGLELNIVFAGLEQVRGNLLAFRHHLVAGLGQRGAAHHQRARAVGAHAELHPIGIAKHDIDIVERHPEFLRHDLREGRFMALAMIVGADQDRHLSGRMHPHGGALVKSTAGAEAPGKARRRQPAGLDIGRIAKSTELAVAFRRRLAPGKAGDIGGNQRALQASHRVAGVVFHQHRGLVGIGFLRNDVAPAQFDAVDAHLGRGDVDDAFDHEGRFRPPGAAIGIDRDGVGEDHLDVAVDRRRGVDAPEQRGIEIGRDIGPECREVGAHIGQCGDLQSEEFSVLVERQFGFGQVIPAMAIGHKALRTVRDPLDRPPDPFGRPGNDRLFAIVELLDAEAAADIRRDHAHLLFGYVENQGGHQKPHHMRELACRPQRVVPGARVVFCDRRARLHRIADQSIVDET